ncbi:DUF6525 family protein [Paracoccus beibuensis]|uniref:DUF6525 family protein n=1 Tax=Paracoccus beibuensis TaxID=547602 RepID=UPI002240412F|nr:DUF6525 family protein [Paracoccus beibuensis]
MMAARSSTPRRGGNLGQVTQRLRHRTGDPMAAYDALPVPLRQWLSQAALPWSPASCLRLWTKARAAGACPRDALTSLDRAEASALRRAARLRDTAG